MKFLNVKPSSFPFSSHEGPNILLEILFFSNTVSRSSSLNVRGHVSQPYSTTSNIIVSYVIIFKFSERSREDNLLSLLSLSLSQAVLFDVLTERLSNFFNAQSYTLFLNMYQHFNSLIFTYICKRKCNNYNTLKMMSQ